MVVVYALRMFNPFRDACLSLVHARPGSAAIWREPPLGTPSPFVSTDPFSPTPFFSNCARLALAGPKVCEGSRLNAGRNISPSELPVQSEATDDSLDPSLDPLCVLELPMLLTRGTGSEMDTPFIGGAAPFIGGKCGDMNACESDDADEELDGRLTFRSKLALDCECVVSVRRLVPRAPDGTDAGGLARVPRRLGRFRFSDALRALTAAS